MDEIIKEDENFIWWKSKFGIHYVSSKKCFFALLTQEEVEKIKEEEEKKSNLSK